VRALIVDDEAPARTKVRRMLGAAPDVEIVGEASTGREAVAAIKRTRPDIVFLDIQMPGLDGFAVVDAVEPDGGPYVVFVTADDSKALRAFEVGAVDYLLKPFTPERFNQVLERARDRLGPTARAESALAERAPLKRLLVSDNGRAVFLAVERIDRIAARSGTIPPRESVDARASGCRARDARVVAWRLSRRDARRRGADLEPPISRGGGARVRTRLTCSSLAYPVCPTENPPVPDVSVPTGTCSSLSFTNHILDTD